MMPLFLSDYPAHCRLISADLRRTLAIVVCLAVERKPSKIPPGGGPIFGKPDKMEEHKNVSGAAGGKRLPTKCVRGDLYHSLRNDPKPWPEAKARREIVRLLRVVTLLHSASAVDRDITPGNVFVTEDGVLKLGDFGIALHSVGEKNVRADAFTPLFAPTAIQRRQTRSWRPADDVYQIGCLFVALLCGSAECKVTPNLVKKMTCSPEAKSIIQRCIGDRRKRLPIRVKCWWDYNGNSREPVRAGAFVPSKESESFSRESLP
jgi:serine/threonine protein kinase